MKFDRLHHVAIICSDYQTSKKFYTDILGLEIIQETFRSERNSWKLDMELSNCQIELFSFPNTPKRITNPEACGLRHIAFSVGDIQKAIIWLQSNDISVEPVRTSVEDRKFTFFRDPDGLPIEIYEDKTQPAQ